MNLKLRCYCDVCGDMIFESNEAPLEAFKEDWDKIVVALPMSVTCSKCKVSPNFKLTIKFVDVDTDTEHDLSILSLRNTDDYVDYKMKEIFTIRGDEFDERRGVHDDNVVKDVTAEEVQSDVK